MNVANTKHTNTLDRETETRRHELDKKKIREKGSEKVLLWHLHADTIVTLTTHSSHFTRTNDRWTHNCTDCNRKSKAPKKKKKKRKRKAKTKENEGAGVNFYHYSFSLSLSPIQALCKRVPVYCLFIQITHLHRHAFEKKAPFFIHIRPYT